MLRQSSLVPHQLKKREKPLYSLLTAIYTGKKIGNKYR
nr:MAG TPA: hypothetical protein [Caudoviricetes sp.]